MKELLFKIAGVVVVLIIVCWGLTFTENEIIDRYNPLVIEKDVYALTKGPADPDYPRRFMYMLNGVDESGKESVIRVGITGPHEYQDTYIKVRVKGGYVFSLEEVKESDVPEKAKEKIKK
ncbi:TPA: YxeA family protein [Bacillus cereus]